MTTHDSTTTGTAPAATPLAGRIAARFLLAVVLAAPIAEIGWSLAHREPVRIAEAILGFVRRNTDAERTAIEDALHDGSIVVHTLLPHYQQWLTAFTGANNKKVVGGRDGWLFLRDDLDLAYGPGIFEPGRSGDAALAVINDFRDQLAERGIELLLVPIPTKETGEAARLSRRTAGIPSAPNAELATFMTKLAEQGIHFVRVDAILEQLRQADPGAPLYLSQDSHWTPRTMLAVAHEVAARATELLGVAPSDPQRYRVEEREFHAHGELVSMLGLADPAAIFKPMHLELERVIDTKSGGLAAPDPASEVLLLGDSFARVFGDPRHGLGEGAGLTEQLMRELEQPIDVIAIPNGGAATTRLSLARQPNRLNGKRVVIWEWTLRALGGGPEAWPRVVLPPANAGDSTQLPDDARLEVVAEIAKVTRFPEGFNYPFCLAIYQYKVVTRISGDFGDDRLWVAFPAIVDRKDTEARSFQTGLRHRLVLEPIRKHHDLDTTPWIDDTGVAGPIWYPTEWKKDDGRR